MTALDQALAVGLEQAPVEAEQAHPESTGPAGALGPLVAEPDREGPLGGRAG